MQKPKSPANIIIVVGAHHVDTDGVRYPVDRIVNHPEYYAPMAKNDAALVRTRFTIHFNNNVRPIRISRSHVEAGQAAVVSGWGQFEVSKSS